EIYGSLPSTGPYFWAGPTFRLQNEGLKGGGRGLDVTKIDPYPKQHTPILRDTLVPLDHHGLHSHRAFDRIDHRRKLKQHTVARCLDDPSPVFCHEGVGNLAVFSRSVRAVPPSSRLMSCE